MLIHLHFIKMNTLKILLYRVKGKTIPQPARKLFKVKCTAIIRAIRKE